MTGNEEHEELQEEEEDGEEGNEGDDDGPSKPTASYLLCTTLPFLFQEGHISHFHPNSTLPKRFTFCAKLFLSIPVYKALTLQ